MITAPDIKSKIETDFGKLAPKAFIMFQNAFVKADYINNDRIIRCIIFLANGNMQKLEEYIQAAITDPRDVILWAEYEDISQPTPKRLHNFNNPFN